MLKDGGLVVSQAQGTRRIYRLNPDGVTALRAYLDRVWEEALTAFAKATQWLGGLDLNRYCRENHPGTGAVLNEPIPLIRVMAWSRVR